ncbi:MAG: hypothetical protein IIA45_15675 [Bacteroidetes bacterium]|nr:hypothetical protein [Bacteroidota bacterium]
MRIKLLLSLCILLLVFMASSCKKGTLSPARNLTGTWETTFPVKVHDISEGCGAVAEDVPVRKEPFIQETFVLPQIYFQALSRNYFAGFGARGYEPIKMTLN